MRLMLAGVSNLPTPDPVAFLIQESVFHKNTYTAQGYTKYEVMCIGATGGQGGPNGIDPNYPNPSYFVLGGGGGGGGLHKVKGDLSALPINVPVVTGIAGSVGSIESEINTVAGTGTSGGYSSFNGSTCRASGGLGGKGSNRSPGATDPVYGVGGLGGIGGRTTAGGGPTFGFGDGMWDGVVGSGGAGGLGRLILTGRPPRTIEPASEGRDGSTNPSDMTVHGAVEMGLPGGGGANTSILTGSQIIYGTQGYTGDRVANGVVAILLT